MFEKIREDKAVAARTAFIAGAYEFISDDNAEEPDAKTWPALLQAYAQLDYSTGALTPQEADKIKALGLSEPKRWQTLDPKEARSAIIDTANGQIGVVYFPMLKNAKANPTEAHIAKIEREAMKLRGQVKLVVGVSSWGVQNESEYLDNAKPVLDVLLGSGPGVGFSAKPAASGKTLWMHTFSKGKAIYTADLLSWPEGRDFKWEMGTTFTSQAVVLEDTYPPDKAVEAMFQGVPDPNNKTAK